MASYKVTNTYIINQCSTFTALFVLKHQCLVASPYGLNRIYINKVTVVTRKFVHKIMYHIIILHCSYGLIQKHFHWCALFEIKPLTENLNWK